MPRYSNFPILFDELKTITMSDLNKWNYLQLNRTKSGTINWRNRYNEITSSLTISVKLTEYEKYLLLDYKYNNEKEYYYKVPFVSVPSNLGKGNVWYFICPFTGKRCRKLHLIQGRFMHRSALPSGLYSKQAESKTWRQLEKVYGAYFDSDRLYEELYSKHFKKYYKGKPTKKYIKLMQRIKKAESVSIRDFERLMVKG